MSGVSLPPTRPFFSTKGPKTILARARPLRGSFASGQIKMAAQLVPLKQCSPESRIAMRLSRAQRERDTQETNQIFKLGEG